MPPHRGTSLIRKRTPLGPYRRPTPGVLGGSKGGGRFFMGEVPLEKNSLNGAEMNSLRLSLSRSLAPSLSSTLEHEDFAYPTVKLASAGLPSSAMPT